MLSLCSPQLGLSPESNSGGEIYDREIISRLCQKGIMIYSLLPKKRQFPPHPGLKVSHAPIKSIVPPHVFNLFVLPYLISRYRRHRFDLIRVHNPYFIGPAAVIFKKLFPHVPVVASYLHLEEGINHLIDKSVVNHFDHIIAISQNTKNEIISRLHYPAEKISVAYPGIDRKFQPGSKSPKLIKQFKLENKTILLFLGGLKSRKNPFFLLDLLSKINQPDVCLIFAGSGPLKKALQRQTKILALSSQVRFTEFIPEKDKLDYYRLADILLLPSIKEGFGMTITEAAACRIPAIGADNSSIREVIINGKTGFLAASNSLPDWSNKLIQLIKSAALRRQMGTVAQRHVRSKFSWEKNITVHLKVFKKLTKT